MLNPVCRLSVLTVLGLSAVSATHGEEVLAKDFGTALIPQHQTAKLYILTNTSGASASITDYGGIVTSILVPDRNGKLGDVVLGYENVAKYVEGHPYFGCITGRYANRIREGKLSIDGKDYKVATNNAPNHLHGGVNGFDKFVWEAEPLDTKAGPALKLTRTSPDGEEGYPGNLKCEIIYTWTDDHELRIDYTATTDAPTIINLTNHSYFNLAGESSGETVLEHEMQIFADHYTPVDQALIPTGIGSLDGTPLDFRKPMKIGARIEKEYEQLKFGFGYDHNYVLANERRSKPVLAAVIKEPRTGRILEVLTTEPGLQFYSGNFLDGTNVGKGGEPYQRRMGFSLEAQIFPDSPNQSETEGYTSALLKPGETYTQTTIYRFLAE